MLTDPKLKSQIDQLWDKLWTGGLSNPLDAIEQLSFLLFMKRLDDEENRAEKNARLRVIGAKYQPRVPIEMRWSTWSQLKAEDALKHVKEIVTASRQGGASLNILSGFVTGNDLRRTAFTSVKKAVFAPIPSARESSATEVNPGLFRKSRTPYRRSCQSVSIFSPRILQLQSKANKSTPDEDIQRFSASGVPAICVV